MPGGDETEVVPGKIAGLREGGGAVLVVTEAGRAPRSVLVVPREPGWGLGALWFSFVAVDVFELDADAPTGRWFLRLGEVGERASSAARG
jgi:hypothetical protein